MITLTKTAAERVPYFVDWAAWLTGQGIALGATCTIATAAGVVPAGMTKSNDSFTGAVHRFWVSGGAIGKPYTVTSRITTNLGHTAERSFSLQIVASR